MTYGFIVRDGTNAPRTITAIQVRDETNTPRDISQMWVRDSNNTPRMVFSLAPPMSASASPSTVSGFTAGTGTATTDAATCTPSGGTPPYSYAWQIVSYDGPVTPTALSPTNSSSTFRQTSIGIGENYSASVRCQVTDSTPGTPLVALSNTVSAFWSDTT